jgi:competence protein ComEC
MSVRILYQKSFVLLLLGAFVLVAWWQTLPVFLVSSADNNFLTVRFLDVGQGDAIHIQTPDGYELLIDGGASALVLRELSKGRSSFDHDIDVVIATHPDTDHVGGLVDVLERFNVKMIMYPEVHHQAMAATAFTEAAIEETAQLIVAQAGQKLYLGASTTITVLSPRGNTENWQSNNASVIVQVVYGDTKFMFTGDASTGIEDFLVTQFGGSLASDVLKLGHHGSQTSTSELFLEYVQPAFAVVSAGTDNRYGHPHQSVVERAEVYADVLSTADVGTIVFKSDGQTVWLE